MRRRRKRRGRKGGGGRERGRDDGFGWQPFVCQWDMSSAIPRIGERRRRERGPSEVFLNNRDRGRVTLVACIVESPHRCPVPRIRRLPPLSSGGGSGRGRRGRGRGVLLFFFFFPTFSFFGGGGGAWGRDPLLLLLLHPLPTRATPVALLGTPVGILLEGILFRLAVVGLGCWRALFLPCREAHGEGWDGSARLPCGRRRHGWHDTPRNRGRPPPSCERGDVMLHRRRRRRRRRRRTLVASSSSSSSSWRGKRRRG